jgi:hypothetical protein
MSRARRCRALLPAEIRAISCCWAGAGPGLRRVPGCPARPGGRGPAADADGLAAGDDRGLDWAADPDWAVDPEPAVDPDWAVDPEPADPDWVLGPDEDMSPDRTADSDPAVGQDDRDLGHGEDFGAGPAFKVGEW